MSARISRATLAIPAASIIAVAAALAGGRAQSQLNFPPAEGPPTQTISSAGYLGREACAACHPAQAKIIGSNSMARAMSPAEKSEILRAHPRLTFRKGPYTYLITPEGDHSNYRVTDGVHSISERILWAFGLGSAGQTYVFLHNGEYYQSRVSFYNDTQSLDITLGLDVVPASIEEAAGAVMSEDEERLCFGCHSTGAVSGNTMQIGRLTPGVTCEGCHGPGGRHVAAAQAGKNPNVEIFNPGSLSTGDLTRFCGSCHRTWEQVEMMHWSGISTVRFQPYRLANSRCFDPDDRRISCLACHDPHETVRRDAAFYDAKCEACHRASPDSAGANDKPGERVAQVCRVDTKNCITCHMPKYSLPGAHFQFTDHEIRIARRDEPYPD